MEDDQDDDEQMFGMAYSHGSGHERIRKNGTITVKTTFEDDYEWNEAEIYDLEKTDLTDNKVFNYILTTDDKLLFSEEKHFFILGIPEGYGEKRRKSSYYAGEPIFVGPVKCAGEIMRKGENIYLNNQSGTYRPREENLKECVDILRETLSDFRIHSSTILAFSTPLENDSNFQQPT